MRVSADVEELRLAPGAEGSVTLDIVNTGTVIDGVRARALGLPAQVVRTDPPVLSLFPDARGSLSVLVDLPEDFPAGRHPLVLEVAGSAAQTARHVDVELVVEPRPALTLAAHPPVVRGRRKARFLVEIANRGNLPLSVALAVTDVESALTCRPVPATLVVPAGTAATSLLEVTGRRRLTGGEANRALTLHATGTDVDQAPAAAADLAPADLAPAPVPRQRTVEVAPTPVVVEDEVALVFRQRPLLSPGFLTALILMGIVALWALAFLLGITKVLGSDPLTKSAPASFFASTPAAGTSGTGGAGGAGTAAAAAGSGAAPAGAAPKTGLLPPGEGGTLAGKVVAASDGSPVGRIVVQAWRSGPAGKILVASAATQSDGTYSVAGLFPGRYLLEFSAAGFTTRWYPAAAADTAATPVDAAPGQTSTLAPVTVAGKPASLQGVVDLGDTLKPPTATVVVRSLSAAGTGSEAARTTAKPDGSWSVPSLPAPGRYEVSVSAPGYQVSTFTIPVNGGDRRYAPTVLLSAGQGSISGQVTDGKNPLGGVTVSTTQGTSTVAVATPTLGSVGSFTLGGLRTPATYVLTFAADGYGSRTIVVDLGPGENKTKVDVPLVGGTGTVSGQVVGPDGTGVGGATVLVGGAPTPVTTTTVTAGSVGLFALSGLPVPGTYTLTVTAKGLAPQTVPFTLTADAAPPSLTVRLSAAVGSITGTVATPQGIAPGGLTVTVTNGFVTVTTQTDAQGAFVAAALAPGTYAVTASGAGVTQQTGQVVVTSGRQAQVALTVGRAS